MRGDPTRGASLIMLSFATSIDAFAMGLSLAMVGVPVLFPAQRDRRWQARNMTLIGPADRRPRRTPPGPQHGSN